MVGRSAFSGAVYPRASAWVCFVRRAAWEVPSCTAVQGMFYRFPLVQAVYLYTPGSLFLRFERQSGGVRLL